MASSVASALVGRVSPTVTCLGKRIVWCNPSLTRLGRTTSRLSSSSVQRVAVLYQDVDPPAINGAKKPRKPGGTLSHQRENISMNHALTTFKGYRDSGADIAYGLKNQGISTVTLKDDPDPASQEGWCFPDTEEGILKALERGATCLWANTILFAQHPLQQAKSLSQYASNLRVVGQPPMLVEQGDDKNFVNSLLRQDGSFNMATFRTITASDFKQLDGIKYPLVAKPVRGRGSHGVKVCHFESELFAHLEGLLAESPVVILEEYLPGQEGTVTVMPPSNEKSRHWEMPMVVRFNHQDGIAPYNGVVAVTSNSRAVSPEELKSTSTYDEISAQCVRVAEKLKATAPIRVDVRRWNDDRDSQFALFDVNMKPVSAASEFSV